MNESKSPVKIFVTPNCVFCKIIKGYFNDLKVEYEEIDITTDDEALNWLQDNLGQFGVPVTVFNDNQFVIGWQKQIIDDYLRDLKLIK